MIQTIDRRRFVAGMSAALLLQGFVHAAGPKRRFPFGFSLYGAPGIELGVALPAISRIGYDGVELSCLSGSPSEPKQLSSAARRDLRNLLSENQLSLISLMENLKEPSEDAAHQANLDRLQAACELGREISPNAPPVIETILGHKPAQWEQVKTQMADRLGDLAALAARQQVVIAIKPHVGNALHLPEQALWLIQQVSNPWIKLAYDYSHYILRGLALESTVAALAAHSAFVHVKDARGTPEKFEFMLPGETQIDYAMLFRKLHEGGYRGGVVVEVSSQISRRPDYDWLAAARRCHENLARSLKGD